MTNNSAHVVITQEQAAHAFALWEEGLRADPSGFLTEDEVAQMEVSTVSEQRAICLFAYAREAAKKGAGMTIEQLKQDVKAAECALEQAEAALEKFQQRAENNVYATLEEASAKTEGYLWSKANEDCEGSHNCGADTYYQECVVDGVVYVATLSVVYNRHDKTYYYVDGTNFKIEPKGVK